MSEVIIKKNNQPERVKKLLFDLITNSIKEMPLPYLISMKIRLTRSIPRRTQPLIFVM